MDWSKVWVVAKREYMVNVRRPAFISMTLLVPLLAAVVLVIGMFFSRGANQLGEQVARHFEVGDKPIGVVDGAGIFSPMLPGYEGDFVVYASEDEARAALEEGEVSRVLVVAPDYLTSGRVTVLSKGSGFDVAAVSDSSRVRAFFVEHLLHGRVDEAVARRAADPLADLAYRALDGEKSTEEGKSGAGEGWAVVGTFVIPYGLTLLLMMTIFFSAGYLLQGVAEEKETRVVELIVSSVRPMELMAGKVIGLGGVGLTQIAVWILSVWGFSGGAAVFLAVAGLSVPAKVLLLGVVYYVLGYLVYAVLMAGVGSLGTTMRESQQLAGVFSFIAAIPYMLGGFLFSAPNAPVARVLSFFPLTAPTMMLFRLPLTDVPWMEVAISVGLLVISLPVLLWAGGKMFRVGVLLYAKRPTWREIWGILRSKG